MTSVTLSRDTTTIDIPLVEEAQTPLFIADFGKPNTKVWESGGSLNPRVQDNWSGQVNYNIVGRLDSYADAIALSDLIKSCDPDNNLVLSNPLPEHPDTANVNPAAGTDVALTLTYEPGYAEHVQVELQLTRVDSTTGSSSLDATTPTSAGSGPIQVSTINNTIDITSDVVVTRSVGRPNDVVRKRSNTADPLCIQKPKVAFDEFSIEFQAVSDGASVMSALSEDIFRTSLGRRGIDLNFNGTYGLGSFRVVPTGSAPFRQTRLAGDGSAITVPTFDLRVVNG